MDSGMEFKHFDVAPLAEDHHYINSKQRTCFSDKNGAVYGHIMKEWRILQKHLPDGIYVQAYETRIDLLRAAIVGPAGTPYHDGLFFFDILLPSDYPNKPPQVHYHSHGFHLNPNLYPNGYVCLSLIHTWSGCSACERWSTKSTVLQLLVSIQGLVLNERPFFNEPATVKYKNSHLLHFYDSISYNEKAFVLSCKMMVRIMRRPPVNYEGLVRQHFRGRAPAILAAIARYEEGCVVGRVEAASGSSSSSSLSSWRFKMSLAGIRPMVSDALASMMSEEEAAAVRSSEEEAATKFGFWVRVIVFLLKVCGN